MNRVGFFMVGWLVLSLGMASSSSAGVMIPLTVFTDKDKVLIMAPHPDDEGIATGGIIQQALKAGAEVRVVLMTNGENNELSFIVYKKRPVLRSKEILAMGEMRYKESLAATGILGLKPQDIIALGYPDFGTMDILTQYWGPVRRPFRAMLSRQRYVPYSDALSFGAPYVGESILNDLKTVIKDFQPTKIFVSHPADTNRDHRALYLFTRIALWDLEDEIVVPEVHPYIVHVVGWPKPRGYEPSLILYVPADFVNSDIQWETVPLQDSEILRKHEAIKQYVSQVKYAPNYLVTFVRSNELFGDYPSIPIIRQMTSVPAWQCVGKDDGAAVGKLKGYAETIASTSYARQGNNFLVKLVLKRAMDKDMGVSVFLMGYRSDMPFAEMPKLNLLVGIDGFHIKDRKKNIASKEVMLTSNDRELIFTVPLSLLGLPERILSSAKTSRYDLTLDETAWRVLLIK